jgi:hypothetical protein
MILVIRNWYIFEKITNTNIRRKLFQVSVVSTDRDILYIASEAPITIKGKWRLKYRRLGRDKHIQLDPGTHTYKDILV